MKGEVWSEKRENLKEVYCLRVKYVSSWVRCWFLALRVSEGKSHESLGLCVSHVGKLKRRKLLKSLWYLNQCVRKMRDLEARHFQHPRHSSDMVPTRIYDHSSSAMIPDINDEHLLCVLLEFVRHSLDLFDCALLLLMSGMTGMTDCVHCCCLLRSFIVNE